jgi:hypothetical protein
MIEIYCFVDDFFKTRPDLLSWRCSPNSEPAFTDAEVITIALMQNCLGVDSLKQTYKLISKNYASAFPKLRSYQQWICRLHRLGHIIGSLFESAQWATRLKLYLIDSKPIPVCKSIRHGRVRLLREEGAYFGKSTSGWFFGFKLHTLQNAAGLIVDAILTPANLDDRDPALELAQSVDGGILLGGLGYRGSKLSELLCEESELLIITRADVPEKRGLHSSVRQGIETLFSQLWRGFIDRVFSRSWQGLWNTIRLKLLNYNLRHTGILSI